MEWAILNRARHSSSSGNPRTGSNDAEVKARGVPLQTTASGKCVKPLATSNFRRRGGTSMKTASRVEVSKILEVSTKYWSFAFRV